MSQLQTLKTIDPVGYRSVTIDEVRMRALNRLYARRDAVDALIRSLEIYEKTQNPPTVISAPKCS